LLSQISRKNSFSSVLEPVIGAFCDGDCDDAHVAVICAANKSILAEAGAKRMFSMEMKEKMLSTEEAADKERLTDERRLQLRLESVFQDAVYMRTISQLLKLTAPTLMGAAILVAAKHGH
jgi:hypothetical protein